MELFKSKSQAYEIGDTFNKFFTNVLLTMVLALGISAFSAYLVFQLPVDIFIAFARISPWVLLIYGFFMSYGLNKLSKTMTWVCFIGYAVVMGSCLSIILYAYTTSSILMAFITTSIMFGCMAIIGKTTNVDLTKFGSLLTVGLITILIVSLLNTFFFKSEGTELFITYVAIVLFLGFVAYDTQKLKLIYNQGGLDENYRSRLIVFGAFSLYLDFINLFIRILSIMGKRRD